MHLDVYLGQFSEIKFCQYPQKVLIYKEAVREQAPRPADNLTGTVSEKVPNPVPGNTGKDINYVKP